MELRLISRVIGHRTSGTCFRSLLSNRKYSKTKDEQVKPTTYNSKGGKLGNYNKYYSNAQAFTFDSEGAKRFSVGRSGEYLPFETFLSTIPTRTDISSLSLDDIDWSSIQLPPIVKDVYNEPEIVRSRSQYEVENFRESYSMVLEGDDIPNPILKFSDYQFPEPLQRALDEMEFDSPMPIQSQTWPIALRGRDVVSIGQTGSGKTLGFVLPAVVNTINQSPIDGKGPSTVILAPTRELVQQIASVLLEVTRYMRDVIHVVCLYGGINKMKQVTKWLAGPQIIVATPGRLMDLINLKVACLQNTTYFVVDEADRMLDMGFEPQLRTVASQIRPDCQTLMWSATWPTGIQALAQEFLSNPIQINVGSGDLYANPDITQKVILTDNVGKIIALREIIKEEMMIPKAKILIFVATKKVASTLNIRLQRKNIPCSDLHGGHNQVARNRVINGLKRGILNVVIATDVASRGLDVNDISVVINYSMPKDIESYVHRIGRTGRAGKSGRSISFFTDEDKKLARPLAQLLRSSSQDVPKQLYAYMRC